MKKPVASIAAVHRPGWVYCDKVAGVRDRALHKAMDAACEGPHHVVWSDPKVEVTEPG